MKKTTSDKCKAILESDLGSKWSEIKAKHKDLNIPSTPKYKQLPLAKREDKS